MSDERNESYYIEVTNLQREWIVGRIDDWLERVKPEDRAWEISDKNLQELGEQLEDVLDDGESCMDVLMSDWADYNQMIREGIEDSMPRKPKEGEDK